MHRTTTSFARIAIAGLSLCACLAVFRAALAAEPPRYQLQVGQQLVYRSTDPPRQVGKQPDNLQQTRLTWNLEVIEELSGGGWRIVYDFTRSRVTIRAGKELANDAHWSAYFGLLPDGTMIYNSRIRSQADPAVLFPPLPPDDASATSWSVRVTRDDVLREFHAASPAEDGVWSFQEIPRTIFDKIYDYQLVCDYRFDLQRGLVTRVESHARLGQPPQDQPAETLELVSSQMVETDDPERYRTEMAIYADALRDEMALGHRACSDLAHTQQHLAAAEQVLKDARAKLTLPSVEARLDAEIKAFERVRQQPLRYAEQFGALLDKPSPEWTTTDLDGTPRSLADYRGKVVLLDFWYRGCGWCVRSFPQLKQLVADFKDQDFVLLGVNSDRNLDDARFVIEAAELPYETIKNGERPKSREEESQEISAKYNITGFPTLVILDADGVVRLIHVGYSPNLREELGKKIRELLAKK